MQYGTERLSPAHLTPPSARPWPAPSPHLSQACVSAGRRLWTGGSAFPRLSAQTSVSSCRPVSSVHEQFCFALVVPTGPQIPFFHLQKSLGIRMEGV